MEIVSAILFVGFVIYHTEFLLARKEVWIERANLVKFERKNRSMTPVLIRNTAFCDKKFHRISEHFSKSLLSTFWAKCISKRFSLHKGKCYWTFCIVSTYLFALFDRLSDISVRELRNTNINTDLKRSRLKI